MSNSCTSGHARHVDLAALALAASALALAGPAFAAGSAYRWVDQDGDVHYGDRMPAEASSSDYAVIDDFGVVRERRRAGDDEAAAEERRRAAREQARSEARARRDRMLRETFSSEHDLLRTRDRRLEAIDARIAVLEHRLERLTERRRSHAEQLRSTPETDAADAAAGSTQRELERVEARIGRARKALAELRAERAGVAAEFAAHLERFREITSARSD